MILPVQSVAFKLGSNVTTVDVTLNGVVAGNFLAIQVGIIQNATHQQPVNSPDGNGNTWSTTTPSALQALMVEYISYAMNVSAGNTTVTLDQGGSDPFAYSGSFGEYSGVALALALDQEASNVGNSTTPTTGTTPPTTQDDELVLACVTTDVVADPVGIDVPPTAGYTNITVDQNGTAIWAYATDYKVVSATGAQSADYGTITSSNWVAKIATFKAAVAGEPSVAPIRVTQSGLRW